ncbi:hypothetical protein GOV10_00090 [Candidatus Woesearchaeota archaeon]|nr:hypothetical protein [Candidatus Woesearchaeota archaeon]
MKTNVRGKLWVIEGPDLAGKDTVIDTMLEYAHRTDFKVSDVRDFWQRKGRHPSIFEIMEHGTPDLLVMAEPSTVNIGKLIRKEYTASPEKNSTGLIYPASFVANAYAQDRWEMIHTFVSEAREQGVDVLCGRNYLSSLVYQPLHAKFYATRVHESHLPRDYDVHSGDLAREYIMELTGNVVAMSDSNAPDEILITTCSPAELSRRRELRKKQDDSLYEQDDFLEALVHAYRSEFVRNICEKTNTKLSYHYTDGSKDQTIEMARREASRLFKS